MKEQAELYSQISRLIRLKDFQGISTVLHNRLFDAEMTMRLLRLTFNWRTEIPDWDDIAKITAEKIDDPALMKGIIFESVQNNRK